MVPHSFYQEKIARVVRVLQEERLKKNLSKNRVAEKAGLSSSMIGLVERGQRSPTLETLLRIAQALEVDLQLVFRRAWRKR